VGRTSWLNSEGKETAMNTPITKESFDYCIDFWEGAIDEGEEIDHMLDEMRQARDEEGREA